MSCCELPGETRSELWSTPRSVWAALTFFAGFIAVFSSGSPFADASAKPGYLMFASVVTLALIAAPIVYREWAFDRARSEVLAGLIWLVASVTFARSFTPLLSMEAVNVGLPRGLLAVLFVAGAVMTYRASNAKWPEAPEADSAWKRQLRALLGRYYSWSYRATEEAVSAAEAAALDARLPLQEALGDPWLVAAEFASSNPQNKRFVKRVPVLAGMAFAGLAVLSAAFTGVSLWSALFVVLAVVPASAARIRERRAYGRG
ncbi:MAG: hypothetical protein Q4E01_07875 [Actinomycetaceae bacterium]|nr:hypothetical protein [Actinomycetaceae bacterium]